MSHLCMCTKETASCNRYTIKVTRHQFGHQQKIWHNRYFHTTPCLIKTVQICFCQHFVKFPPILTIFGKKDG